jgi:hypothetical protein
MTNKQLYLDVKVISLADYSVDMKDHNFDWFVGDFLP